MQQIDANMHLYLSPINPIGKTMATQPNRLTLALDEDTIALLKSLEAFTGLSPAQTIAKLLPSHLPELWEYLTWLEQLPEGPSKRRSLGLNLIQNYGPDDLIDGIKRIDPTFVTEGEKLTAGIAATQQGK